VQVSESFTVDALQPLAHVDLRLPEPVSAVVEVVDPQSRPVRNLPIQLNWSQVKGLGQSWVGGMTTDLNGRITFADVNAEVPQYRVSIRPRRTWQPIESAPLNVDGKTTRLVMQPGEEMVVTVLDIATGQPVAGVEVYATRVDLLPYRRLFEAESLTDENGQARFSNLPNTEVIFGLRGMNVEAEWKRTCNPGRQQRMELRGEIPPGSR